MDWIAFDADDTLWRNEETYRKGTDLFLEILSGYGIDFDGTEDVIQLVVRNIPYYGYGVMSFVLSLIEIAIDLTEAKILPTDIQRLLDHGKEMISEDVDVFHGIDHLLETLSQINRLMLITKGDLFHQQRKIHSSGLESYFSAVEVVSEKSTEVYRKILERHKIAPDRFVMIGNSFRSDIVPVLKLGGWAFHLKSHLTWSYENEFQDEVDLDRYVEVNNISDLLEALKTRQLI